MKVDKQAMKLYVVTDRSWLGEKSREDHVEAAIRAGATFVQLREKHLPAAKCLKPAQAKKAVTDRWAVPFVVNDAVEVAMAVDADGVHIGQQDLDARDVRRRLGPDKILGVSAQNVEQALLAQESGADYIGVGAVFATGTKKDADSVSLETLQAICSSVSVPVVAIGGIDEKTVFELKGTGIDGIAVVSAIFASPDVAQATRQLLGITEALFYTEKQEEQQ